MGDDSKKPAADRESNSFVDAGGGHMSFGDHLEELRSCLIRAIFGIVVASALTMMFSKSIMSLIFQPLYAAQIANGLPVQIQALAPADGFFIWIKIGLLSGLILAMPWVMYQVWMFVAAGLYDNERGFVRKLVPATGLLFATGVLFLYFIVLPIVLHFFIKFNRSFSAPEVAPGFMSTVMGTDQPKTAPTAELPMQIPLLEESPEEPHPGDYWFDLHTKRLKVCVSREKHGIWSIGLTQGENVSPLSSLFAISEYVSFVLMLALAFGIAFELPIVVFFLSWTGILPAPVMARGRRYVLLGIVIAAAILTPPDVVSQLLLAGPMYLLFEVGLLVAYRAEKRVVGDGPGRA